MPLRRRSGRSQPHLLVMSSIRRTTLHPTKISRQTQALSTLHHFTISIRTQIFNHRSTSWLPKKLQYISVKPHTAASRPLRSAEYPTCGRCLPPVSLPSQGKTEVRPTVSVPGRRGLPRGDPGVQPGSSSGGPRRPLNLFQINLQSTSRFFATSTFQKSRLTSAHALPQVDGQYGLERRSVHTSANQKDKRRRRRRRRSIQPTI